MKEKIQFTELQKFIELLTVIVLAILFGFLISNWQGIPERIPSHYNAEGIVDGWSGKGSLLAMPIVCIALYIILTVVSFFPKIWNMPVKITEENKTRVYNATRTFLCFLKLALVSNFSYITYCMAEQKPLSILFLPAILLAVFGTTAVFIIKIIKAAKPQ